MTNKNSRIVIVVIVLLLIAGLAYWALRNNADEMTEDQSDAPVSQTTATPEPDQEPAPEESAKTAENTTKDEQQTEGLRIPTFDVLRVEPDGTAVIAGAGEPLGLLDVKEKDSVLASSEITDSGDFVAIVEIPLKPGNHQIYLNVTMADGRTIRSEQTATVSIPDDDNGELLALITEPGKASEIISAPELQSTLPENTISAMTKAADESNAAAQASDGSDEATNTSHNEMLAQATGGQESSDTSQTSGVVASVTIKAVEIEDDTLYVAGEGAIGSSIRGYIDDVFLTESAVTDEGNYVLEAENDVSVGLHTIRVDMLDPDKQVTARAIVPFNRPAGDQIAAISNPGAEIRAEQSDGTQTFTQPQLEGSDNAVIIRRGDNLWRISRRVYGRGVRYTTIYLANETVILNPNLIEPGQVFSLPGEALPDSEAEDIHRRLLEGLPIGPQYQLPLSDQ